MNYYLARDGQTYGPYPQENFASMLAAGQVVAEDLVCPEGGQDWVQASQVPGLLPAEAPVPAAAPVAATAAPAASSAPRLRLGGGSAAPSSHAPAAATVPPVQAYPKATYPSQNQPGLMEKAAGAWGVLKIVGYGAVALIVVIVLIVGFVTSRKDKKEIAKLHSLPGWQAFHAANSRINSESSTVGYGNTSETTQFAQKLAEGIEVMQENNFPPPKRSRVRSRSKLVRIASAASAVSSGLGSPQIHVEKKGALIIALIHVPEFSRYGSAQRGELSEACFAMTQLSLASMMKMREQLSVTAANPATPNNRPIRPPGSRVSPPVTARPPSAAAAPVPAASPPKPPPELTLVVGVRGKSAYEYVYVSKVSAASAAVISDPTNFQAPDPVKGNVPSHQELVKWFGEEKPQ